MPTPPKAGSKAEIGHLRRRMRALDASTDAIAAELGRQHGLRPRQACRLAHGWDQTEATAEYNDLVQRRGPEHDGRDSMTPSRMSEYERWPTSGRRPSPYVLRTLAELYSTTVDRLLDHADLQALSPTERAALTAPDLGRAPSTAVAVRDVSGTMECERVIRRRRRAALVELIRAGGGPDNDLDEFIAASAEQSADQLRDLNTVAGTACALLAWMSGDLAQHHAALTHAASAWVFADRANQPLLQAFVRTVQAKSAYWANRVGESADHARDGLTYLTADTPSTVG